MHPRLLRAVGQHFASAAGPLRVLELGAGVGTMVERLLALGLPRGSHYRMVDRQPALLARAAERLRQPAAAAGLELTLSAQPIEEVLADPAAEPVDLLVAHALLDLVDLDRVIPLLARQPARLLWLTATFDGVTTWLPPIEAALDARIEQAYHLSMDRRHQGGVESGGAHSGRRLLAGLAAKGLLLDAGSADWVVWPRGGAYPHDEGYFLDCLLHFVESSLRDPAGGGCPHDPGLSDAEIAGWLAARRAQRAAATLVLCARHLDVLAAPATR